MLRRPPAFATVAVIGLLSMAAAGCGSGSSGSGAEPFGSAPRAMPAHTLAFVDVNLDRGSTAWTKAIALGQRFPGWKRFVTSFQRELNSSSGGNDLRYSDIEPWLGNEAAIGVTGVNLSDQAHPVDVAGYVAVTDEGKLEQTLKSRHNPSAGSYHGFDLFRAHGSPGTTAAVGSGALLVANDVPTLHAEIDAWRGSGDSLAGEASFTKAMDALPADSLVTAYVDGAQIGQLLSFAALSQLGGQQGASAAQLAKTAKALRSAGSITASFGADANGFRVTANAMPAPGQSLPDQLTGDGNHPPSLITNVPADAFVYFGERSAGTAAALQGNAATARAFTLATGLSLVRDVAPLLSGDIAGYASPGLPFTGAVLLRPANVSAATAALSRITAAVTRQDPTVRFHWLPGHHGQVVAVGQGITVGWRQVGDVIAISNDPAAGAPQSPGLADGQDYVTLAKQAGVPDQVSFLAYLGVPGLLKSIPGIPPDPNAAHVGGFVMWAHTDSSGAHFDAYLQIR